MGSKRLYFLIAALSILIASALLLPSQNSVTAQSGIRWDASQNISISPEHRSWEPFLLADPAGKAHLFWAENVTGDAGVLELPADTLMYTYWDTNTWSEPVDIKFSGGQGEIINQQAILDDEGKIHLIWTSLIDEEYYGLLYSSAHSNNAGSASAWRPSMFLADDLTGTTWSIALAYDPPQTLHVIYARIPQGDQPEELRAVSYIRSDDGGVTWTKPVDIFTVIDPENGASSTRLLIVENSILATWTEWGPDGNGKAVYLARSLDRGETWENPFPLARIDPGDYERDWLNLAVLGENTLVAFWEGGPRAFFQSMYSYDLGATWTDPVDTFPLLVGENGYLEYAHDSAGRLYGFFVQRARYRNVGDISTPYIWYSIWQRGERWQNPISAIGPIPISEPRMVIVNGNRIVLAWSSFAHFEIMVMTGEILDAPEEPPRPWTQVEPVTSTEPAPTETYTGTTFTPTPPAFLSDSEEPAAAQSNVGTGLIMSILPAMIILAAVIIFYRGLRAQS